MSVAEKPRHLAVLRNRSVLALLSARSLSLIGNAMAPVALAFAVLHMPGGSPTTLGLVLTARMAAQVGFVLFGGVLADRLPRNLVMVGADIAAGCTQAAVGVLIITETATPGLLVPLAIANGAATALFEPASRSLMPRLVSGEALQAANALLQLSIRGGTIVGAALAGLLVAVIGPGPTILVDAGTFLASALLLGGIRVVRSTSEPAGTGPSMVSQLRDGWRAFVSRRWVPAMVLQLAFVNMCLAGSFYVLGPAVTDEHLGGAPAWAAILTLQAIGFVSGSVVALKIRPRRPLLLAALMMSAFALPLFFLASHGPLLAVAAAAFAAAICIDIYEVLFDTTVQQHVPGEVLSRVVSYQSVASFVFVPLGLAVVGPVSAAVGVQQTLVGAAVLIVLAGPVVLVLSSVRGVRAAPVTADGPASPAVTGPDPACPPAGRPATDDPPMSAVTVAPEPRGTGR
jgi:predicted MFS family arabinose efflux permease